MRSDPETRRRLFAQLGALVGFSAAVGAGLSLDPPSAQAGGQDQCPQESECSFAKPNLLFVLEYSTAMNEPWSGNPQQSRWEAAVEAIAELAGPGSFLSQNAQLALLRFGHDPDPDVAGTTIPGDSSGLVDGVALELEWDDAQHVYQGCNGQELLDILAATPAPMQGMPAGIGAWTKGALDRALVEILQTRADHPEDEPGSRRELVVVIGSGAWTSADGQTELGPPSDDPTLTAAALFDAKVETHVRRLADDPMAEAAADALAAAGGSGEAVHEADELLLQIAGELQQIIDAVTLKDTCPGGLTRVMVVLDASSSMLNVDGGLSFGAMGETPWDQVREAFRGVDFNLFDAEVQDFGFEASALAEFGLTVFGDELPAPGEQRVLVQYERCVEPLFEWALDPQTACEQPGCNDPWAGPPIEWTFEDSSVDLPGYPLSYNHMPACQGTDACAGSGSYLHLGLELVAQNQADYHTAGLAPNAQHYTSDETQYINILITDGSYAGDSTDAQVQAALEGMFAVGVTTHVIGFGELAQTPEATAELAAMADWGSGGSLAHHAAPTVAELELALTQIANTILPGPCCAAFDCDDFCPWDSCGGGDGDGGPGDGDGDPGDGDGDPGDGDGDPGDGDGDPGDGDGDPGDSETEGTNSDDDGTGDDAVDIPIDNGCNCTTTPDARAWPTLLLLLGLGVRRRRQS